MSDNRIICIGKEFNSEEERREYFRKELRKKLPDLKKIEGFTIGEDDDIIDLSDPPYYTACPNPWLSDFIDEWEKEKESIPERVKDFKVDEPYASDVSEGKNNPIYNAHSYHTKVPHPAIMRYILHYTQPGDIVFDGFAGTGMTGVAAQLCGKPDSIVRAQIEKEWKDSGMGIPIWGVRKSILGDLSSMASFISYNYNSPVNADDFILHVIDIISKVEEEYSWMYKTLNSSFKNNEILIDKLIINLKKCKSIENVKDLINKSNLNFGRINYIVWSDVFLCSECNQEIIFWEAAVNQENGEVKEEFNCPNCNSLQTKKKCDKARATSFDQALGETITILKTIPVMINYSIGTKRFEKKPDKFDVELIMLIEEFNTSNWFPKDRMPEGDESRRNDRTGITHVHHFYNKRSLYILSLLRIFLNERLSFFFTSLLINTSKMGRYGVRTGNVSGTLYVPSLSKELNIFEYAKRKLKGAKGYEKPLHIISIFQFGDSLTFTQSSTDLKLIYNDTVDYIFTDPPFGANIMYSELNYIWESWIKVKTDNENEAIENNTQHKGFLEYQELMLKSFKEFYRILKPNKWMTVEFSNTSAAVWNGIQTSIQRAGFVIANVAALDKKQGSFKAVTTTTAVKQDLIISCYKPSEEFENKFKIESGDVGVWDFVREHLLHLPIQIKNIEKTTSVVERNPKILYDRLITFYIMRGLPVPIDAGEFQTGLKQKFIERDGMYFTSEQATQYDEIYNKVEGEQFILLLDSIYSESEAVLWLKERLRTKPQTYQQIMPDFRIANRSTRKGELIIELKTILEENFIQEKDQSWRIPNMSEVKDRESLRSKALLREFNTYINEIQNLKTKKLNEIRIEVMREGFKKCWDQKDFKTIVTLAEKIPQNILLEDEQLLMFYDIAKDRI